MNAHKTIVHVMGMGCSKYGGIERHCVELSKQLAKRGYHSVFVYDYEPEIGVYLNDLKATGAEVFSFPSRNHVISFCYRFIRILRAYNVCLVHAHFTKARFYAIPLAHLMGVRKLYYTFHSEIDSLDKIKPFTRLWYHWVNRYSMLIAVSEQIKKEALTNWPNAAVEKIYLGSSPIVADRTFLRNKWHLDTNKVVVLTIANFNYIKGLDVLVDACKILIEQYGLTTLECWIVGQLPDDKSRLSAYVQQKGMSNLVKLFGVSNAIPDFIGAADIYVQPSRSEGLGLSVIEAMSFGLPVVASNVGGLPETVENECNGFLVEPQDPMKLAKALADLALNTQKRYDFGANSKTKFFQHFVLESNLKHLIDYYDLP